VVVSYLILRSWRQLHGLIVAIALERVGRKIDIFLHSYERGKIEVIKVLREITGLGLRDLTDLVNFPDEHPSVRVTQATSKRAARRIKQLMKEQGAVISVVPEVD